MLPLKKLSLPFIALLAVTAQATPVLLEGSFSANTTGLGLVTGSFSKILDVTSIGAENFDNVTLDSFSLSPSVIGSTTFDVSQVGADFRFSDGIFVGLIIGGYQDGIDSYSWSLGGPVKSSDILLQLSPSWTDFAYTVDGLTYGGILNELGSISYEVKLSTPRVVAPSNAVITITVQ